MEHRIIPQESLTVSKKKVRDIIKQLTITMTTWLMIIFITKSSSINAIKFLSAFRKTKIYSDKIS